MSSNPLVVGNWKMNTTVPEGIALARDVRAALGNSDGVDVVLLPPFTHLWALLEPLTHSPIAIGAQNCYSERNGAFTGEISPVALAGWCDWVLIGHSERRHLMGETDEEIGRKLRVALEAGLRVIVAVGETQSERDAGATLSVITRQINSAFGLMSRFPAAGHLAVAYEPVWAIGTGLTATPEQAEEVCAHIATHVGSLDGDRAQAVRVIYGGSVTGANAAQLFAQPHISGALVGGASLRAGEFVSIANAARAG